MTKGHMMKKDDSTVHKNLDRHLLSVTFVSLMAYRVFCIIAAIVQHDLPAPEGEHEYVLLFGEALEAAASI